MLGLPRSHVCPASLPPPPVTPADEQLPHGCGGVGRRERAHGPVVRAKHRLQQRSGRGIAGLADLSHSRSGAELPQPAGVWHIAGWAGGGDVSHPPPLHTAPRAWLHTLRDRVLRPLCPSPLPPVPLPVPVRPVRLGLVAAPEADAGCRAVAVVTRPGRDLHGRDMGGPSALQWGRGRRGWEQGGPGRYSCGVIMS